MFSQIALDGTPFVIAEVGQNHQGDLETAREYIRIYAYEGADAIKFQTRDNKYLFSKDAYEADYASENAFAETYGAHREKLELKPEWLSILKEDCVKYGVKFMSTPFDEPSLKLLEKIYVDIKAGDMVTLDNLSGRIFNAQYIPVRESNQVIGRVAKKNIAQGEAIQYVDLENWFTNDQQGNVVHC